MSSKVTKRHPILFCFCAPSGSGKTTITKRLAAKDPQLRVSISTTTRAPRSGEVEGREYFFVSHEEFEERARANEFLEHATFSGNHYGTGRNNISLATKEGLDLLLDIDVQGAEQVRSIYPAATVVVFVFPPSFAVLKERLTARATEDPVKLKMRLDTALSEIEKLATPGFSDYLLINDDLDAAVQGAAEIIAAERRKTTHIDFSELLSAGR